MSDWNRREYLKTMAMSIGAVAGSQLPVFGQRSRRKAQPGPSKKSSQQRESTRRRDPGILHWNVTEEKPTGDEFVTVIFGGLTGFAYDSDTDEGKVGFHGGHSNSHKLVAKIYYNYPTCTEHTEQPKILDSTKNIYLRVLPDSTQPVHYFEKDPMKPFDRLSGDAYDFRWLPDLDGSDFYPENYGKH